MVELALTFTIIGILTAMMIPKIGRTMQATRVNRTSAIVAADLEQAFTLAGRFRRPMRITCTCGSGLYTIADLNGGTVRLRRRLIGDTDLGNMTLAFEIPVAGIVDVLMEAARAECFHVEPRLVRVVDLEESQAARILERRMP